MKRSKKLFAVSMIAVCSLLFPSLSMATPLTIALDIQGQGLSLVDGGVGLEGIGTGTRSLTVNIGGPVQAALLYWAGRDRPCPESGGTCVIPFQPYKDQLLRFDSNLITGTVIGTEAQPVSAGGPINNIGYLADVTALVQARGTGLQTFNIQDGDTASNLFRLNGAGLLVIYTDPSDTASYRIIVYDGLDFAYSVDPTPGSTRVTDPVVFNHGSLTDARQATLRLFVGDTEAGRPDRVDISNNPSILNGLDGSDGARWDTDALLINIPGNVASTAVQLFSGPVDANPDSLLWQVAVLRVALSVDPPVPDMGCGGGYWKNHTDAWAGTGYSPGQTVSSVFSGASAFPSLASQSLLQALEGGGGPGALGAARILLRAAVAALLNASDPNVNYPRTTAEVIADVNAALASNDRQVMLDLAAELDDDNSLPCPLN